jgi:hypothetical protein
MRAAYDLRISIAQVGSNARMFAANKRAISDQMPPLDHRVLWVPPHLHFVINGIDKNNIYADD